MMDRKEIPIYKSRYNYRISYTYLSTILSMPIAGYIDNLLTKKPPKILCSFFIEAFCVFKKSKQIKNNAGLLCFVIIGRF